jgi:hypothetical protein
MLGHIGMGLHLFTLFQQVLTTMRRTGDLIFSAPFIVRTQQLVA